MNSQPNLAKHFAPSVRNGARLRVALLGAAAISAYASMAGAATASSDTATTGSDTAITEVTVTARHREESLQSVPIAISVVQGGATASKNLNDIGDISSQVPAVDFRTSASNKDRTVFVRGAGTISTSPGVEPSVSTVVDGVVMARAGQSTVDLLDLDHIEVLRGPQGTLFGKNASAGVVNIVTKSPSSTLTAYIDAGAYEGGEYRVNAGVSGPLMDDKLKGLLAVFYGTYQGNVRNLYNNSSVNGYDHEGLRAKLVATPSQNLTLTFEGDYIHSVDTTPTGVWVSTNHIAYPTNVVSTNPGLASLLTATGVTPSADNTTESDNLNSNVHDDNGGLSAQADWDFGNGYRLTSITAYRSWRNNQFQDYDQTSQDNASFPQVTDIGHLSFNQTSEELRIASPKGKLVDFVGGLYFLDAVDHETYERDDVQIIANAPVPNSGLAAYGTQDHNYAVFGEANLNFTKSFRVIAGARAIWDDLSYYHNRVSTSAVAITGIQPTYGSTGATTKEGIAARVGMQYDFSSDVTSYVTISRGYKGPAFNVFFNMNPVNTPVLNPETSLSYEAGIKAEFFEHRLQADIDVFETDFSNYQANFTQMVAGGLVTNLINAGSVTTRGVEADLTAKPIQNLTLNANMAYDDAHVVNFFCPPGAAVSCNINGQPLPFAPKWKMHLEGGYKIPINELMAVDLDTEYNWQSSTEYSLSETPDTVQGPYGIWNASVALMSDKQGWSIRLLAKNLLDKHYSPYIAYGDLGGVVRWVPRDDSRYFGVNVHKDF